MLQAVSLATFLTFKVDFNKYVLIKVKEMKHFLVKIPVNNV